MALYKLWEVTNFSVVFLKCYYVLELYFFLLNLADIPANENSYYISEKLEQKLHFKLLLKCLFLRLLYTKTRF